MWRSRRRRSQPRPARSRGEGAAADLWRLGALNVVTTLTGSALLALALAAGRLDADEAWAAAHVDEDWNMEFWGRDELALARRAYRFAEMQAAAAGSERSALEHDPEKPAPDLIRGGNRFPAFAKPASAGEGRSESMPSGQTRGIMLTQRRRV